MSFLCIRMTFKRTLVKFPSQVCLKKCWRKEKSRGKDIALFLLLAGEKYCHQFWRLYRKYTRLITAPHESVWYENDVERLSCPLPFCAHYTAEDTRERRKSRRRSRRDRESLCVFLWLSATSPRVISFFFQWSICFPSEVSRRVVRECVCVYVVTLWLISICLSFCGGWMCIYIFFPYYFSSFFSLLFPGRFHHSAPFPSSSVQCFLASRAGHSRLMFSPRRSSSAVFPHFLDWGSFIFSSFSLRSASRLPCNASPLLLSARSYFSFLSWTEQRAQDNISNQV